MHTQTSNLECKQSVPPILRMYNGKYHCAYIMTQKKISYVLPSQQRPDVCCLCRPVAMASVVEQSPPYPQKLWFPTRHTLDRNPHDRHVTTCHNRRLCLLWERFRICNATELLWNSFLNLQSGGVKQTKCEAAYVFKYLTAVIEKKTIDSFSSASTLTSCKQRVEQTSVSLH